MAKHLFITGTGTDVGKTHFSVALIHHLRHCGHRVGGYKPVASGGTFHDQRWSWSDAESIADACGCGDVTKVCPQRFRDPLSPPMAAARENREVDETRLIEGIQAWREVDWMVIEGAGGAMSPISKNWLNADCMRKLAPDRSLLVASNRLGVQHDVLATVTALQSKNVLIDGVVLSQVQPHADDSVEGNAAELSRYLPDVVWIDLPHGEPRLTAEAKATIDRIIDP